MDQQVRAAHERVELFLGDVAGQLDARRPRAARPRPRRGPRSPGGARGPRRAAARTPRRAARSSSFGAGRRRRGCTGRAAARRRPARARAPRRSRGPSPRRRRSAAHDVVARELGDADDPVGRPRPRAARTCGTSTRSSARSPPGVPPTRGRGSSRRPGTAARAAGSSSGSARGPRARAARMRGKAICSQPSSGPGQPLVSGSSSTSPRRSSAARRSRA